MRKGILSSLRDEHTKKAEMFRKRKPVYLRLARYYFTEEDRRIRKKEVRDRANKKHNKIQVPKWRKKKAEQGLVKMEFTAVPIKLRDEINHAFRQSGLSKAKFLETVFRAWEGYTQI